MREIPFGSDVQDLIESVKGQTVERFRKYDRVRCDGCGKPIEGGHTRLETGQILHHDPECADRLNT